MTLRLATYIGKDTAPLLPVLARLCMVVFHEWPHLYDGDSSYDPDHLQALAASPTSALIVAYDGQTPVGASTCLPLADATANVQAPFRDRGIPVDRFFYLAESVLLPGYRGQGVGAAFFALREAHIRAVSDCDFACFCTVQRPDDHPGRPPGAVSLDVFRRRRGYVPVPGFCCTIAWREIGNAADSEMTLQFWFKSLTGAPLPAGCRPDSLSPPSIAGPLAKPPAPG